MKVTPLGIFKSLWLLLLLFVSFQAKASHIVGGEVTYQCLGNNSYRVVVTMFRDCSGVIMQPTTNLTIRRGNGVLVGTYFIPKGPSSFINVNKPGCGSPTPNVCIETAKYTLDSIYLPPSSTGYYFYNQGCCRNNGVNNILNAWKVGSTFSSQIIGNSGICNSSPSFNQYPPVVLPANVPLAVNVSASDPDSDSLSYDLCAPLDDDNFVPPFVNVPFAAGYSSSNLVPATPPLAINPSTGIISGRITSAGKYSVGICITEWRNGVIVGTVRRDYQFTVIQPWAVFASVGAQADASCATVNNGSATIAAGGGQAPYTYAWSGGGSGATRTNLAPGTYTVTVTDNVGCKDVVTVVIGSSPGFTAVVSNQTNAGCGNSGGGSATISVSGGTPPYTVTWPDASTGLTHNNLTAGTHAVVVNDAGNCPDTIMVTIASVASTLAATGVVTDEFCPESFTGKINVTVTSGNAPFSFLWNDAVVTEDRTSLKAGAYWVAITDNGGCTDTLHFTVGTGAGITASFDSIKQISCSGLANGYLSAKATNAQGALKYLWSNNSTASSISGLSAGAYWVVITDSVGCKDSIVTVINAPDSLKVNLTQLTHVSCNGLSNGVIAVTAQGGTAPYTYSWNNSHTSSSINKLPAGSYTVTVTDANGCIARKVITVTQPAALQLTLKNLTHESCSGSNGSISVGIKGGTKPYAISWNTSQTDSTIQSLGAGTYTVNITDSNGCTTSADYTINPASPLNINVDSVSTASCGLNNGFAAIMVSGGVSPYSIVWSNSQTGLSATNLGAGSIQAVVTDSTGCSDSISIVIPNAAGLSVTVDSISAPSCAGLSDGFASITSSGGVAPLTIRWSNSANLTSTNTLPSGAAYVVVVDAKGCKDSISFIVPNVLPLQITLDSLTNVSCNSFTDGKINITVSGGTAPYSYSWTNGDTTSTLNKLGSGSYGVTVTDSRACSISATYTINEPDSLQLSLKSLTNVSCYGGNNGQIAVGIKGGTKPYSIAWNNAQIDSTATNLIAGNYSITITDASGCSVASNYSITQPTQLEIALDSTLAASCGQANGTASVIVTGGSGTSTVNWSNNQTGLSVGNLAAGNYTAIVTDSLGCKDTLIVNIPNAGNLIATLGATTSPGCVGSADGTASVSATGGTAPYSYLWSTADTTSSISNLTAGQAWVVVSDSRSCSDSIAFTINGADTLKIKLDSLINVSCNGVLDGKIKITVSGGTAPYSYSWTNGDTTSTLNKLGSGSYGVTVTDARACSISATYTITEPDSLQLSLKSISDVSCFGGNTGQIAVGIKGGTKPYSIVWNNAQTDSTATNLVAGSYSVIITDAAGCSKTESYTIVEPTALTIALDTALSVSCGQANGSATVVVTGGSGNSTVSWSNSQTGLSVSNLASGNYTAIATDSLGCTDTLVVSILNAGSLVASLDSNVAPGCIGGNDGFASASASGGTAPYTYLWNNAATTSSVNNLSAGPAWVIVTDNRGCSDSIAFTVASADTLKMNLDSLINVSCKGALDGKIKITISGGTAPYSYSWTNGDTTSTLNKLGSGSYGVTVTDARACSISSTFTITEPDSLQLSLKSITDVSCFGGNNAQVAVAVSGGTKPYSILWSNSQTDSTAANLVAGNYSVTVTDASGCSVNSSFVVTEPTQLAVALDTVTTASCGQNNGSAQVTATGGTAPYTYNWTSGSTADSATSLASGIYTVVVTDSLGCSDSLVVTIPNAGNLTIVLDSLKNIDCYGSNDGFLSVSPAGGVAPYTYSWSNGDTLSTIANLTAGNYTLTVSDNSGCTASAIYTLTQKDSLAISLKNLMNAGCDTADGQIAIGIKGGVKPYTVLWSSSQTDSTISNLGSGNYTVVVTDANGCSDSASYSITAPAGISIQLDTVISAKCAGPNGSATISLLGGVAPFTITWSNAQTGLSNTNLLAGTYTVNVVDSNGCEDSLTVIVPNAGGFTASLDSISGPTCGSINGYGFVNVTGASGQINYLWSNGDTTAVTSTLPSGAGFVLISDSLGCNDSIAFTLANSDSLKITLDSLQNVNCYNAFDGKISISVTGGTPPYSYSWTNGDTISTLNKLGGGSYGVTVTDSRACSISATYTITESDSLELALKGITNVSCVGLNDGEIAVSVKGGVAPYNFLWSNAQTDSTANLLFAGNYILYVTDALGCQVTDTFEVTQPDTLSFVIDSVLPASCGQANGYVKLSGIGGTAPYTFEWNTGQLTNEEDSLVAQLYTVKVTDSNGCTYSEHVNVPAATPFSAQIDSIVAPSCYGLADGKASVSAIGGTAPYGYSWMGGDTTGSVQNLTSGNTYVIITDARGCVDSINILVPTKDSLVITLDTLSNVSCNGGADGFINVSVTGGNAPYSYNWSNADTTKNIANLTAGSYTLTVTDAKGCTSNAAYTLTQPDSLQLSLKSVKDVSCNGGSDGELAISIVGGTKPYSITWSNAQSDSTITGLTAGIYVATITDAKGCSVLDSFSVQQPDSISLTLDTTGLASCGQANGSASVTVIGGTGAFTLVWDNGEKGLVADSLLAGMHTVVATDSNGCSDSLVVNILSTPSLVVTLDTVIAPACTGDANGIATVVVTGGTAPYTYNWLGGDTTASVQNLTSGNTYVIVTDARGCTDSINILVPTKDSLVITLDTLSNVSCNSGADGFINVSVTGGNAPYSYNWSNAVTTNNNANLTAGSYTLTVTDAKGCTSSATYTLTQPDSLQLSLKSVKDVSCNGGSDGELAISIVGGTKPYSIAWSNAQADSTISGLSAGTYVATITDANGCSAVDSFSVQQPTAISLNLVSTTMAGCGKANGTATISATGGTGNYTATWDNGERGLSADSLLAGMHLVIVTDSNGCADSINVNVQGAPPLVTVVDSIKAPTCHGGSDGYSAITVSGGMPPYSYLWNNNINQASNYNLQSGVASVVITDALGCKDSLTVLVPVTDSIKITLDSIHHVLCYGDPTAYLEISVDGGTKPYAINWNNNTAGKVLQNGSAGFYTVTVTDSNGCMNTALFEVTEPDTFYIIVDSIKDVTCNGSEDGAVYMRASNGHTISSIQANKGKVGSSNVSQLGAGKYSFWIENANGCGTTVDFEIKNPAPIKVAEYRNVSPRCDDEKDGIVELTASGGNGGPYFFVWDDGVTNANRYDLAAGRHSVIVTDVKGCTTKKDIYVAPKKLAMDFRLDEVGCSEEADARLVVHADGATLPFTLYMNGEKVYQNQKVMAGNYTLTLVDADSCSTSKSMVVEPNKGANLFFASAFTPNNDGLNDTYELKGSDECLTNARLEIFTRWGGKVFSTDRPFEEFWDGTVNGQPAKVDIYMYNFISDEKQVTGHLNVLK